MSRIHSHIGSAAKALDKYDGSFPLAHHLKKFFSAEKKYGSKDRKSIAALCYVYFRTGYAMKNAAKTEKIIAGLFLTEGSSNDYLKELRPEWNDAISQPIAAKLVTAKLSEQDIFPFSDELSDDIETIPFTHSLLNQPGFYLRMRPGKQDLVCKKLTEAEIGYKKISDDCILLPNSVKADALLDINRDAVIQDMNSQRVLDHIDKEIFSGEIPLAWDCCAASGGKSILLYDKLKGKVSLTVSDIRESILVNLQKRLAEAKVPVSGSFVVDLSQASPVVSGPLSEVRSYDIIICDAPCTGSGTWSRTPEQLYYFNRKKIDEYASLQKKIISNSVIAMKPGGLYFYITCSVFKKENEAQATYLQEHGLTLVHKEYLKGYNSNADTMFTSVFKKT